MQILTTKTRAHGHQEVPLQEPALQGVPLQEPGLPQAARPPVLVPQRGHPLVPGHLLEDPLQVAALRPVGCHPGPGRPGGHHPVVRLVVPHPGLGRLADHHPVVCRADHPPGLGHLEDYLEDHPAPSPLVALLVGLHLARGLHLEVYSNRQGLCFLLARGCRPSGRMVPFTQPRFSK